MPASASRAALEPSPPPGIAPSPDRRPLGFWTELLVLVGTAGVCVLWLAQLARLLGAPISPDVTGIGMLPLATLLTIVIWQAPHRGLPLAVRRAWGHIAVAVAAWVTAGVVWELTGRPPLSGADALNILFFPLALAGVLSYPAERDDGAARMRFWLDAGVVMLSGAAGIWYFVVWPMVGRSAQDAIATLINGLYPVGDLVLLFAACIALYRRTDTATRRALAWLAGGLICRFVGDLTYGRDGFSGEYVAGGFTDLAWLTAVWALAVGATVQARAGAEPDAAREPAVDGGQRVNLLPYVSVAGAFGFLLLVQREHWSTRVGGVLIFVAAVTTLVLLRQFLATRENVRLLGERATRDSEARFRAVVQHASDIITVVDAGGRVRYASPAIERVLQLDPARVVGAPLVEQVHPDDVPHAAESLALAATRPGSTGPVSLRLRRDDGAWRTMDCVMTNLLHEPTVAGLVVTARDVTERAELEARLAHQAFHDPLTGLANRTLLRDRVRHSLARQERRPDRVAVLFLDLDDFKTVNDSLGHAAGDRLLCTVAERLLNATRGCDTVARLGGDEFAVLLDATRGDEDAIAVAGRVLVALTAPIQLDGAEVAVAASIGIARAGDDDGADELLRNADVAMYRAKQRGKSGYEIFAPEMHAALLDRLALEADLRRALADGTCEEFRVHYQPIVRLAEGRISGMEALVRWQHPRRGLVAPADFIPSAESTGLIVPLGRWVLGEACRQMVRWQERGAVAPDGAALTLTVNLSGRQLQHPDLVRDVADALAASGLVPSSLVLEITETVIMRDTEANLATLHALRALGVRLAIDDFGTGYSSLAYLKRFPIDILKIDKAFVDGVGRGGSEAALARTIVALGDTLALRCVAEGIEMDEQREHLQSIGCEFGQGYLFARPLAPELADAALFGVLDAGHVGAAPPAAPAGPTAVGPTAAGLPPSTRRPGRPSGASPAATSRA